MGTPRVKKKAKTPKRSKRPNRYARITDYRSGFEKQIRGDLDSRSVTYQYEQHKFKLHIPAIGHFCPQCSEKRILRVTHYIPDFLLLPPGLVTGSLTFVEAKGKLDARSRRAITAFITQYPQHKLYLLFQRDNWMTKTRKRRYTDWCRENGIQCAVGTTIPDSWIPV